MYNFDMADFEVFDILPFTRRGRHGRIDYWSVESTGDWAADCATGRRYAEHLLDFMRETGLTQVMGHVFEAIGLHYEWAGIEAGFTEAIAEAATGLKPNDAVAVEDGDDCDDDDEEEK